MDKQLNIFSTSIGRLDKLKSLTRPDYTEGPLPTQSGPSHGNCAKLTAPDLKRPVGGDLLPHSVYLANLTSIVE
jgi:hypothetical protein